MSIYYDPKAMLRKAVPEAKIAKMLSKNISVKKTALNYIDGIDFIDKKKVTEVALKTVRGYQERIAAAQALTGEKSAGTEIKDELLDDPKQLIQRVQNEVVFQVAEGIKSTYAGEQYEWLPSDADEPDPEHQALYGTIRTIGVGEMPGERYGCRCGMNILVKQTKLDLD